MRRAAGIVLFLASFPVGGYGLLYLAAISTSDSSPTSLAAVGGLLLAIAAALIAAAVALLRGGFHRSG